MSIFYQVKKYLQYRMFAGNEHSIHSPFVFTLYTEVISNKNKFYSFEDLNIIRTQLLGSEQIIEVKDFGAGSKRMNSRRKISDIAKYSCINKKNGELIFRLIEYFKPETVLELGTSLGLSSLYIAKASPKAKILTIEGCPNTFSCAGKLIEKEGVKNVETINSSFDEAFETVLSNKKFDFVYIDGNHTYEATLKYFHELLKITNENSVLIFDDIYWT